MPDEPTGHEEISSSEPYGENELGALAHLRLALSRIALIVPEPFDGSRRSFRASSETFDLLQQVSRSTGDSADAAQLLRKAYYQLLVGILHLDGGGEPTGFDECRRRLRAAPELLDLFPDLLATFERLDPWIADLEAVREPSPERAERFLRFVEHYLATRARAGAHLDHRMRAAGISPRPMRRLWWGGSGLVAVVLLLVLNGVLGFHQAPAQTAGSSEDAVGGAEVWQSDDPNRCFAATYYADQFFEEPVHQQRDCQVRFEWEDRPLPEVEEVPKDEFCVRWEGDLIAPATDNYVFHLASDDGSRLYLNGELLLDNWGEHGMIDMKSPPTLLEEGQRHPIRLLFFDATGDARITLDWSASTFERRVLSGRFIWQPEPEPEPEVLPEVTVSAEIQRDPNHCFAGRYYSGIEFDQLIDGRRDCLIDFEWDVRTGTGIEGIPVNAFSVRWEGILEAPESGSYVFYLGSDDGSRLFVGDQLVANAWAEHGYLEVESEAIPLRAGTGYPIKVEYFEKSGLAQVRLMWSTETMSKRLLSGAYISAPSAARAP